MSKQFYFEQFSLASVRSLSVKTVRPGVVAPDKGLSGPGSDGNEEVLCIPQSSSIIRPSPSDCLVSYPGHSLGRKAVGVFFSPSRLGKLVIGLNSLFKDTSILMAYLMPQPSLVKDSNLRLQGWTCLLWCHTVYYGGESKIITSWQEAAERK